MWFIWAVTYFSYRKRPLSLTDPHARTQPSTSQVEERRRVMEAEAGMTDEEMGDSRRIKEKEAVIVGRIEGAKWALERAVQVKAI